MLACYRPETVERHDGGIEGVGLFSREDLPENELVAIKGGRLVTERTVSTYSDVINGSHHQVAPNLFLAGLNVEEVDATLIGYNHSCEPNIYVDGQIALRTMRPVVKGEELTVDYATIFSSDTQSFNCRCGSANCRHHIQPSLDSQNPVLLSKYDSHLADFIANSADYEGVELVPIDPECPASSWINGKLSRVEAKIHGIGLVAISPVRQGELLAIRGGTLVTAATAMERQSELQGTEMQISDDLYLAGLTEKDRLATMIGFNHSCSPNTFVRSQIGLFAMSDIEPGVELTVDYGTAYISSSQHFNCNCGSLDCRGVVNTNTDWQQPVLQKRFSGHFADFIQRKINSLDLDTSVK
jgi:hypothetical protein